MQRVLIAWRDGISLWTALCEIPKSAITCSLSLLFGLALLSTAIYFTPSSRVPFPTYDRKGTPSAARKRFGHDGELVTYIRNVTLGGTSTIFFLDIVLALAHQRRSRTTSSLGINIEYDPMPMGV